MGTSDAGKGHRKLDESYSKSVSACCSSLTERIAQVAPTANRCMIENLVDEPVEFVHLIPPTGIPSVVSRSVLLLCEISTLWLSALWLLGIFMEEETWDVESAHTLQLYASYVAHWFYQLSIIDTNYHINSWYQTSRSIQQGKMDSPTRATYTGSLPRWQMWSNVRSTSIIGTSRFLNP